MKTCPQCDTGYPDSHTTCPKHGVLLNEIRDLRPGMVIRQNYRIIRKLGQGGFGAVYLAQHILMDEPRALKFLSGELSRDQAFIARFRREVRTLRQVRNRNVVDCGDLEAAEDDSLFFPMEFVDGPDLRSFLYTAPQPFDVALALAITRGIAEGVGAAHVKGMVHRDIKPENILIAQEGDCWVPKIADFGIVATKESRTTLTRTGGTLLTMNYAAPEQWRGTRASELDGRTDLYALGGVLYEMLTGQTPFRAENYEGWYDQHQHTPPQPPSTLRPDLTNWQGLDALVLRLLAKDREDRPKDVAELLGLLDAVRYLPTKSIQGVPQDYKDDAEVQFQVGLFCCYKPDYAQAAICYRKAAVQGHAKAQYNLAILYEKGQGVLQDYAMAAYWLQKAADQGHSGAQFVLGVAYIGGKGVPHDLLKAADWIREAALQGIEEAQYLLGYAYEEGRGLTTDYTQAAKWYRMAAEQGEGKAQARLGLLYCSGKGVSQSYVEAYFWEGLAAARAKQDQRDSLVKICEEYASKLSPDELSKVQVRVNQWLATNQSKPQKRY